ncbi:hypothetical protein Q7P35_003333 [Cladosporium inversicolor]
MYDARVLLLSTKISPIMNVEHDKIPPSRLPSCVSVPLVKQRSTAKAALASGPSSRHCHEGLVRPLALLAAAAKEGSSKPSNDQGQQDRADSQKSQQPSKVVGVALPVSRCAHAARPDASPMPPGVPKRLLGTGRAYRGSSSAPAQRQVACLVKRKQISFLRRRAACSCLQEDRRHAALVAWAAAVLQALARDEW